MSKSRTKKLRAAFEEKYVLNGAQRDTELYKRYWRKFKKEVKHNR